MSDAPSVHRFAARLLQQDEPLSELEYQEYRMQLETALTTAIRREKIAGWIAGGSFVVAFILMFVGGSKVLGEFDPTSRGATALSIILGVVYVVAQIAFPLALASYFSRFRPAVKQARDNIRDASIAALRSDVAELRKELAAVMAKDRSRDS